MSLINIRSAHEVQSTEDDEDGRLAVAARQVIFGGGNTLLVIASPSGVYISA